MAVRLSLLLTSLALVLGACSQEPAVDADENAAANDAAEVATVVQNSMVNMLNEAENAVDASEETDRAAGAALSSRQAPGWGSDVDAFGSKDISLDPIADAGDLRKPGEMGCAFVPTGGSGAVLVAKADVSPSARAIAVISNHGVRARLAGATPGGFGALAQGTRLAGTGVTADIKLTSRVSLTPVGQQSSYPASLTVTAGKERRHIFAGRWICGLQG